MRLLLSDHDCHSTEEDDCHPKKEYHGTKRPPLGLHSLSLPSLYYEFVYNVMTPLTNNQRAYTAWQQHHEDARTMGVAQPQVYKLDYVDAPPCNRTVGLGQQVCA